MTTENQAAPSGRDDTGRHLWVVREEISVPASPEPAGDVAVYDEDGTVVVLLRGTIDITVVHELEEAGRHAVDRQFPIMVDVRHVDMIDSVGISFLVRVAASVRSQGRAATLCGPAPLVEEMLAVAGAAPLFEWTDGRPGPDGQDTP